MCMIGLWRVLEVCGKRSKLEWYSLGISRLIVWLIVYREGRFACLDKFRFSATFRLD